MRRVKRTFTIVGIVVALFFTVGCSNGDVEKEELTFVGDGFELTYNSDWELVSYGDRKAITHKTYDATLLLNGESGLSAYQISFETEEDKEFIYNKFDLMIEEHMNYEGMVVTNKSAGFSALAQNVYYTEFTYGMTTGEEKGKYYVLVSVEGDCVISFMSNIPEAKYLDAATKEIEDILKSIVIKPTDDGVASTFVPGKTEEYHSLGYIDYIIPDCWTYNDAKSAEYEYNSYVFDYKDGKSMLAVKAYTPMNMTTFEVGATYETVMKSVNDAYGAPAREDIALHNDVNWYHVTTGNFNSAEMGRIYIEIYFALSSSGANYYLFEFYISTDNSRQELEYINESIEYILDNASLLKYDQ